MFALYGRANGPRGAIPAASLRASPSDAPPAIDLERDAGDELGFV
jgi:hypothetical protein